MKLFFLYLPIYYSCLIFLLISPHPKAAAPLRPKRRTKWAVEEEEEEEGDYPPTPFLGWMLEKGRKMGRYVGNWGWEKGRRLRLFR